MTVWVRLWNCGVCDGYVYFDDDKGILICECGVVQVDTPMPPNKLLNYRILPHVKEIIKPNPFRAMGVVPVDVMNT